MSDLRLKMQKEMKLRRFAVKTQVAYLNAVQGLARHYNLSPDRIDNKKIQDYLLHLMDKGVSWSTCNVAVSGLKFFYNHVIKRKSTKLYIPPRKQQTRLPEILAKEELERLFNAAFTPRSRIMLMTAYAGGLRVSEVANLKVSDLDSARMMIRIGQAKGNKDRYTILSERLLTELRSYWKMYRPKEWLFPSKYCPGRPITVSTIQKAYNLARKKAGVKKGKGIHTLRHCFATHMLEAGVDLRTIQVLLGHNSITTTMVYLQISRKKLDSIQSPFDLLDVPLKNDDSGREGA